ncbi:MAG: hypothetical protein ACAI44_09040 [Candidatus Sericytochromatia bacterium]
MSLFHFKTASRPPGLRGRLHCFVLIPLLLQGCQASIPSTRPSPSPSASPQPVALKGIGALLPEKLELAYSWGGLSPVHPEEDYSLKYLSVSRQYQVSGKRQQISSNPAESKSTNVDIILAESPVSDLFKAMKPAVWTPAKTPASEITHTDDYPSYSLSFEPAPNHTVKLFSTSNTSSHLPWNLQIDRELYTTSSEEVAKAVNKLFELLRPSVQG